MILIINKGHDLKNNKQKTSKDIKMRLSHWNDG